MLLSGWPSTFAEFAKVVPLLTEGTPAVPCRRPVVAGLRLLRATTATGWTPHRIAGAIAELMDTLGYERYGAHGGDWGAMVSSQLGLTDPAHCVGVHLSMVIAPKPADPAVASDVSAAEQVELERMYAAGRDQMGYQRIQATQPQTLSVGLMDSPVGLAAWIVEKFRAWSDCGGRHRIAVHQGRTADQPHDLLGHRHDRVGQSHLRRDAASGSRRVAPDDAGSGADGLRQVPRRCVQATPALGR